MNTKQQDEFVLRHLAGIAKIIDDLPLVGSKPCRVTMQSRLTTHHAALMGYFLEQSGALLSEDSADDQQLPEEEAHGWNTAMLMDEATR